jgi:hypothetical protein
MTRSNIATVEDRPKYPLVKVAIMSACGGFHPTVAAVQTAMRQAGIPLHELSAFYEDAAGGGDNLLRTCQRWVDVDIG